MKSLRFFSCLVAIVLVVSLAASEVSAQEERNLKLDVLLEELVQTHDRIQASKAQLQAVEH